MRRVALAASVSSVLLLGGTVVALPAQADTGDPYDYTVDESVLDARFSDVTSTSAVMTWTPGAFHYESGAYPSSCRVDVDNSVSDAHPITFFGKTFTIPAWTTTLTNGSAARRSDTIVLVPGETSHVTLTCTTDFGPVIDTDGTSVMLQVDKTWKQSGTLTTQDVAPLAPSLPAAGQYDGDRIRVGIQLRIAGKGAADRFQVRMYRNGALAKDLVGTIDGGTDGAFVTQGYGPVVDGSWTFAARVHNTIGWGPWATDSPSVQVTGHPEAPAPGTTVSHASVSVKSVTVKKGRLHVRWASVPVKKTRITVSRGGRLVTAHTVRSSVSSYSVRLRKKGTYRVTITAVLKSGAAMAVTRTVKR